MFKAIAIAFISAVGARKVTPYSTNRRDGHLLENGNLRARSRKHCFFDSEVTWTLDES